MDELMYVTILKSVGLVASIVGVIIGLDLILGARVTSLLKRVLERSYDFDKTLRNVSDKLNKSFEFDKVVSSPRVKVALGLIFFGFSLIILLLIRNM